MDLLQRELERKKQALAKAKAEASLQGCDDDTTDSKKRKYIKVSDLKRIEEEEEEAERLRRLEAQRSSHKEETKKRLNTNDETPSNNKGKKRKSKKELSRREQEKSDLEEKEAAAPEEDNSPAAITRKLRQMGLVIRFYGESNEARLKRLKEALEQRTKTLQGLSELEEFRLGKGHGIRNPFLEREKDSANAKKQKAKMLTDGPGTSKKDAEDATKITNKDEEKKNDDDEDDESDPPKYIYKFLKGLLKQWEQDLADRPVSVANSVAGKNESKTLKQCKDYIRPLFKLLKNRKLEDGLQLHLLKIVNFAKQGEFVKAHDAYMDVAIGRAAWPIGVTMVGIHARSGRAKIESANVAHVMNSELQRKYLTSVKRLLTYYQKIRTDVDPSKKVS
jgi:pre-mRNA-splicing factor 18